MLKKRLSIVLIMLVALMAVSQVGAAINPEEVKGEITVFHAGSLAIPFKQVEEAFEAKYPQADVVREAAGSRTTVRKVTDLGRKADVVGSADYTVIEKLMMPEFANWRANFATNEMAIMYTPHSKYADKINADNWYKILLKDDVSYAHSNPNADPCGYRSQLVWKLAEKYYNEPGLYDELDVGCPAKNVRPKETDLIAMLESGEIDYLFIYRSVAKQHDMPFVILPEKISLKTNKYSDFYSTVSYDISGKAPGEKITKTGRPMVYGVTIPKNAPNKTGAVAFMKFLLSEEGQEIMRKNGQPPIAPAKVNNLDEVPTDLRLIKEE
ncbi:tungstate ABC transporter substrate-binding protein WtpA [Acetohalobium arabaticum]|uniref:Tungstate/molybdate binding protein n=1 Tax=Acetohalobium arabaticum (strain ATCC 49924 / DSM 5501 / Z-7288) TaxID=574087 RepID=D9QQS1_ACEAZ|nr:tungstate ABC transporter substrate-binding protein WtpA [Acetohalobium arabaticum]ADL12862.1 tungstate/molybdate binding protein [Acetohalobium arabaticum DSM 5501]